MEFDTASHCILNILIPIIIHLVITIVYINYKTNQSKNVRMCQAKGPCSHGANQLQSSNNAAKEDPQFRSPTENAAPQEDARRQGRLSDANRSGRLILEERTGRNPRVELVPNYDERVDEMDSSTDVDNGWILATADQQTVQSANIENPKIESTIHDGPGNTENQTRMATSGVNSVHCPVKSNDARFKRTYATAAPGPKKSSSSNVLALPKNGNTQGQSVERQQNLTSSIVSQPQDSQENATEKDKTEETLPVSSDVTEQEQDQEQSPPDHLTTDADMRALAAKMLQVLENIMKCEYKTLGWKRAFNTNYKRSNECGEYENIMRMCLGMPIQNNVKQEVWAAAFDTDNPALPTEGIPCDVCQERPFQDVCAGCGRRVCAREACGFHGCKSSKAFVDP